jgi:hypothetical protein
MASLVGSIAINVLDRVRFFVLDGVLAPDGVLMIVLRDVVVVVVVVVAAAAAAAV